MNELSQMLAQKFNLSPETSQQIVSFLLEQVKGKLPEGLASHIDGLAAAGGGDAGGESGGGLADTFKNMAASLLNKQ